MKTQNIQVKTSLFALALGLVCAPAFGQANISGSAISLNGTNGYLSLPSGIWFNGDFTVEAWVYARSYNNWSRLIDFSDGPDNYNVYLALSDGTSGLPAMGVFTNNNGTPVLVSGSPLPLNQWAHLAATLSGTTATIYINGKAVGSATLNIPPAVTRTNIYIGRSAYAADSYANAIFDEIRIWDIARTQTQIQTNMNRSLVGTETGLVGYWRLDEGAGTNALDSSVSGRTAALAGGAVWTNSGAPITRQQDYALSFSNQLVTIPHTAALDAYPLTVMCWFLAATNSSGGALINKYQSSSFNGYQMFISGGHLLGWYIRDSVNNVFNGGPMDAGAVNDGLWHHAAMVVDASGGRLYLDGTLKSSLGWSGSPGAVTTTLPLELGIYPGDSIWIGGELDEASIWNVALTTAQVQQDMNFALQGNEPGLLAYYPLNEGIGAYAFDYTTNGNIGTLSSPPPTWTVAQGAGATSLLQGPQSGTDSIIFGSVPSGRPWTASTSVAWLHLNNTNGTGSQNVIFSFDQNPGSTRTGALNFGSQTVTITQAGHAYVPGSGILTLYSTTTLAPLAVDSAANVYIGDDAFDFIKKVDFATKSVSTFFNDSGRYCYGLGLDAAANLYVSDDLDRIVQFNPAANTTNTMLQYGSLVSRLVVAPSGDAFFWGSTGGAYMQSHLTGQVTRLFTLDTTNITAWAVDAGNNLYLYYYTNKTSQGSVYKWSPSNPGPTLLFYVSSSGDIAVDGSGNVYAIGNYGFTEKWFAANGYHTFSSHTNQTLELAADNWGDVYTCEWNATTSHYEIRENVRAYVNTQPVLEPATAGTDSIAPVLQGTPYLGGALTPTAASPWLTVNGVTNGTISFSFTAYSSPGNRKGYLNVLGTLIPVYQGSPTYTLASSSTAEGPSAGSDSVVLAVSPATGNWTATANNLWLHLSPAMQSGSGSGPIVFSFDANTGGTRTGTLTLGGQTFSVTQAGATYVPVMDPTILAFAPTNISAMAVDALGDVFASSAYGYGAQVPLMEWLRASNNLVFPSASVSPPFVTASPQGTVYVNNLNSSPFQIQQYNELAGTFSTVLSSYNYFPAFFVVGAQGQIIFVDGFTSNLVEYNPDTATYQTVAVGPFYPRGMVIDAAGNVFWTDNASFMEWNASTLQTSVVLTNLYPIGVAVDAAGNLYLLDVNSQNFPQLQELSAATGTLTTLPLPPWIFYPQAVAADAAGDVFITGIGPTGYVVGELPRAFVDPTPKFESTAGGSDTLPPVLPTTANLQPPFAPWSDQSWLTINSVSNGSIGFAFSSTTSARSGDLMVLGQNVIVSQGTNTWLGTTNLTEGPAAGSDSFVFGMIPANRPWTTVVGAPWLHVSDSGGGGGNIAFSYDANPGTTRSGTITIGGQTLTVTQAGASYVLVSPQTTLTDGSWGDGAPCGIALDAVGNVYYCDTYNNAVKVWSPANNQLTVLGSTGFNLPYALGVDGNGVVYIADTYNNVLKEWSPATSNITTVVTGLSTPFGVAVDSANNVYIGDSGHDSIKKWFPATGGMVTIYYNPGSRPTGVAVDAVGNVYWVESGTGLVQEWSPVNNTITRLFGASFNEPHGVAVDGSGNVYVADYPNATYKWTAANATLSVSTANTIGVAVDGNHNMFVADALDSKIYEIPRAFVNPTPRYEGLPAGQDVLPPVLPSNENLLPPFAPWSDQSWLTINSVNNGSIGFGFSSTASGRAGNLFVLGQNVIVNQGTNTWLGTTNLTEGPTAGSDSFVFAMVPANRPWTTVVGASWLHVPASGVGGGNIAFSYDANPGPTRSGTITIGGQTLTVTQAGASYVLASPLTILTDNSWGDGAPCGVALDAAGNVFYCDTYNNAVKVWSPSNNQLTVLGSTGFNLPYALAVDGGDNVYIADTYNNVLKEWSPATSNITTVVNGLSTPFGVAVDSANNVYIGDSGHDSIKKWFPATSGMVTIYSNPGSRPTGVAVDAVGNVYWVESGTGLVQEWSPVNNTVATLFTHSFNEPHGVAVDGSGNVYVADYPSANYKWTAANATLSVSTADTIGVAVDGNDNVFIANALDSQIYEIPRAFVNPTPRFEGLPAGQDVLPPVLPSNENLLPPFAPSSDQPWLTISGIANDAVGFAFSTAANARAGHLLLLGQQIAVVQGNLAPAINLNPTGGIFYGGQNKQLIVSAFGTPPLYYQWRTNGVTIHDAGNLYGSSTPTLTLTNLAVANSGNYDVVITNVGGSVTSTVAIVTVGPAPALGSYAAKVVAYNPLAYWRLNETNGTTAYDYSGGFNGTYAAASVMGVPGPTNPPFAGFEANNTAVGLVHTNAGSYVSVPFGTLGLSNVSFTAWLYPVGLQDSWAGILMTRNGSTDGPQTGGMGYNAQQMLAETWNNNTTWSYVSGLVIPSNTWSLVSMVIYPDKCILYVDNTNGLSSATNATPHTAQVFLNNWRIGNDALNDPGRTFNGAIDEVAVFPYSLTGAQIQQLFNVAQTAGPAMLNIQLSGGNVILTWPTGTLLQADAASGPYTAVPGHPASPFTLPANGTTKFFRVQVQ